MIQQLRFLLPVVFALAGPAACRAQITDQASASAALAGKSLYMKGFWSDDQLAFDEKGQPLRAFATDSFTTSGIDIESVRLNDGVLRIEGSRVGTLFVAGQPPQRITLLTGKVFKKPEKIEIEIDGRAGDDFETAVRTLFAADLHELLPVLPAYWKAYALKTSGLSSRVASSRNQALPSVCDAVDVATSKIPRSKTTPHKSGEKPDEADLMKVGAPVHPPKVLKSVDPTFSDAARKVKASAETRLSLIIDQTGAPHCLQVVNPAGLGLDERAIAAVTHYVFAPATKDGVPVKVTMNIDVNFQIF